MILPTSVDLKGVTLLDRYQCVKVIGLGGFASVWLADEMEGYSSNRSVAIKVLLGHPDDRTNLSHLKGSFEKELKSLGKLYSESIVMDYYMYEIVDLLVDDNFKVIKQEPYTGKANDREDDDSGYTRYSAFILIMEYAEGGTLADEQYNNEVLQNQPDNSVALNHFIDICNGLAGAHRAGVYHCDVKPSNFLWFRNGNRVKVADFGISQFGDDDFVHIVQGGPAGSLPYMPPESFALGAAGSSERDIYSLGCSFYEILTGKKAFDPPASMPGVLEYQEHHGEAPRPEAYVATSGGVSNRLSGLIVDMLSVAPDDRPSIDFVITELNDIIRSREQHRILPEDVLLPGKPTYLSLYNISPKFRQEHLRQRMHFIFLSIGKYGERSYRALLAILENHFPDSYSIFEVYGKYDFVIRVWAQQEEFSAAYRELKNEFLNPIDKKPLTAQVCEDVAYFSPGSSGTSHGDASDNEYVALTKLRDVQQYEDGHLKHDTAAKWLLDRGFFSRIIPSPMDKNAVKSFCLLSMPRKISEKSDVISAYSNLKEHLANNESASRAETRLSIYRCAATRSAINYFCDDEIDIEDSELIVVYTEKMYSDIIKIPEGIVTMGYGFQPKTLLATNRIYKVSDRVAIK